METIFERKVELQLQRFSFGLDIKIDGSKTTFYTHKSPLVTYSSYTIHIKLNSWCNTDGPNGWKGHGCWYNPYGGINHKSNGIFINTVKEIEIVLDYLKKLELTESDFSNLDYLPTLQGIIQTKLESSKSCPNQISILCEEIENLHKINKELQIKKPNFAQVDHQIEIQKLQKDNRELRERVERLHETLHKHKSTYHMCGFWEYGKEPSDSKLHEKNRVLEIENAGKLRRVEDDIRDSKLHEKIRVLEIENAGKTRQLRKVENDIAKLKETKQSDVLSFTQANTIGQALMDSNIYNCM